MNLMLDTTNMDMADVLDELIYRLLVNADNRAHHREGLTRRLLIVLDIFWAEAARLRDLDPWQLMNAADVKQKRGTGTRNRKRLFAEIRRVGAAPFWAWRAARLVRQLRWSEWQRWGHRSGLPRDLREEAEKWALNAPR